MALPLAYNVRNVLQRPVSTLATAAGIGLVVAILIGALALASGFQAVLVESGSPDHAIVLRAGADSEISSAVPRQVAAVIRALPAVAADAVGRPLASPELVVVINLPRLGQAGSSNVVIRGVTADAFRLRDFVRPVAGRHFAPASDEVMVGERIARRFANCRIGDRLRLGPREFTVVGHFSAGGTAFESEIWGDESVLGPALNRGEFQSLTLRLADPARFAAFKAELERDPRLGVKVRTERAFYAEQSQLLAGVIRVAGVLITLIMAVGAVFGAMNTMYAAVGARTREIAVLLTLGFSPFAILVAFLIESVLIAFLGGVIGCLLAAPINGITTSTTNWSSFSEVAFAFRVTPVGLAAGLAFAIAIGVAGGLLPAWRASRQPAAAALRAL